MKIALAQTKSIVGNIQQNIKNHKRFINCAVAENADLIVFPELSLTGYEPRFAKKMAIDLQDLNLDELQVISNSKGITITVGVPIISTLGICISMLVFQANKSRKVYSKQLLHTDELPYFVAGTEQLIINYHDSKIAPAICYESLQTKHIQHAITLGANIYMASVAKSQKAIDKSIKYFSQIAKKYAIPVLMVNSLGFCDNFESKGQTSIWGDDGVLLGNLCAEKEGILFFDTDKNKITATNF